MVKGRIGLSLITAILLLVVPVAALAATYSFYSDIEVVETGGNTYSYYPFTCSQDINYLVDNNYISSTGLDTELTMSGVSISYMLTNDRVTFVVPSVEPYENLSTRFFMDHEPLQDNFDIIPGYDGYVTIPDDATIELGDAFEIEQKGWVDTSAGTVKGLVYKESAFRTYISGDTDITSAVMAAMAWSSPTGFEDPDTSWSLENKAYDESLVSYAYPAADLATGTWSDFIVLTSPSLFCDKVRFYVSQENPNAGDKIDLDVYYDSEWHDVYEGTYTASVWVEKSLEGLGLVTKTKIRLYNAGATGRGYLWEFDFWAGTSSLSVTATGVASGKRRVVTTAVAAGNLTISVYDEDDVLIDDDFVAMGGASIPDNANDYIIMQNCLPYMEYMTIDKDGVETLRYEPIMIVDNSGEDSTAGAGSSDVKIIDATLTQADDYWNGARLIITDAGGAAPEGETVVITDFLEATDELQFAALTAAVDAGDTYTIDFGTLIDETGDSGTADSGTTTTLIDAGLTEVEDYWNNMTLEILLTTDGLAPQGESATITDFVAADDELQFAALTAAVGTGDTYELRSDGRITWGVNPEDLSVTFGSLIPYGQPTPGVTATESPDIVTPYVSPGMFTESPGTNMPGYGFFKFVSDGADIPIQVLWFGLCIMLVIAIGIVVWKFTSEAGGTGSMLWTAITCGAVLLMFTVLGDGLIPIWTLVVYTIVAGGMVLLQKVISL